MVAASGRDERIVSKLLAEVADRIATNSVQDMEELGIELWRSVGLAHNKTGNSRVKLERHSLKKHWVVDVAGGMAPIENTISKHEFKSLAFALDLPSKLKQVLKKLPGPVRRPLRLNPPISKGTPRGEKNGTRWVVFETLQDVRATIIANVAIWPKLNASIYLGPAAFEPTV